MAQPVYFEDFQVGQSWDYGGETITKEEVLSFAIRFDPEPFHADEERAKKTVFGGLIASGIHTFALWRRMDHDFFTPMGSKFVAAAGFDDLNFVAPARPGDELTVHCEVIEKIPIRSRPDRGLIKFAYSIANQHDTVLMTMRNRVFIFRRPESSDADPRQNRRAIPAFMILKPAT
jgi:acyl dehydratase